MAVVQCYCREKGLYHGKIDGFPGPMTEYAIAQLFDQVDYFRDIPGPANVWPHERDVDKFYGEKGKHQVKVPCPYPLMIAWNNAMDVHEITIHEKLADSLARILQRIYDQYGITKIKEFGLNQYGGSLNVRLKRGSNTQWSMHSWGIAIDWFPQKNQLRWGMDKALFGKPEYRPFWEIWEAEGWTSLGRARNFDWMHVQAANIG